MEIKKQVILRSIANEHILVPTGDTVFDYNGIFVLTESGKLLWEHIEKGENEDALVSLLIQTYGIDKNSAAEDVSSFLGKLKDFGIL